MKIQKKSLSRVCFFLNKIQTHDALKIQEVLHLLGGHTVVIEKKRVSRLHTHNYHTHTNGVIVILYLYLHRHENNRLLIKRYAYKTFTLTITDQPSR